MTWLGYDVILTHDQKIWALVMAIGFALFGRVCDNNVTRCVIGGLAVYVLACLYAINENAMYQSKADFCHRHPAIERCGDYLVEK